MKTLKVTILISFVLLSLPIFFIVTPRLPQWPAYHQFADTRSLFGIPNFWNVVTNLPFVLVSMLGLIALKQQRQQHCVDAKKTMVFFILFSSIFLIGLGSAYYHWAPDNARLVWDRLPMTLVFMSLLSWAIMERIDVKVGFALLWPLIFLGLFSVWYWHWTEAKHLGDLRPYALVQFYSIILIILMLLLFPMKNASLNSYVMVFLFYLVAKLFEYYDAFIYHLSNGLISGHSLKHLFMAISAYYLVVIFKDKA